MIDHISLQVSAGKKEAIPLTPLLGRIGIRRRHGVAEWGYRANREQ